VSDFESWWEDHPHNDGSMDRKTIAHDAWQERDAEIVELNARLSVAESKEVCTVPHSDEVLEFCPYCKIEKLREAAEIFRDFGEFQHLYREYDLAQVEKARKLLGDLQGG
jgi:hypothetical protein